MFQFSWTALDFSWKILVCYNFMSASTLNTHSACTRIQHDCIVNMGIHVHFFKPSVKVLDFQHHIFFILKAYFFKNLSALRSYFIVKCLWTLFFYPVFHRVQHFYLVNRYQSLSSAMFPKKRMAQSVPVSTLQISGTIDARCVTAWRSAETVLCVCLTSKRQLAQLTARPNSRAAETVFS